MVVGPRLSPSKRLLLGAAFLSGVGHPGLAHVSGDPVRRAALAALGLDSRLALLDRQVFAFHRLADQPLGLSPHRFLRHALPCPVETNAGTVRAPTRDMPEMSSKRLL